MLLNVFGQIAAFWEIINSVESRTYKKVYYPVVCNRMDSKSFYAGLYRVSQEEWTKIRESVPYVKIYRYNPKHLYPKLNGYGDNGQRSLKV